jgi:O-antigen ligase
MLPIGLAAAAVLFFWMAPGRVVRRLGGLADLTHTTEITLVQRELAARDTLRIFRDHPWVGIGLGSFEAGFPQYRTFPTDLEWTHAHNDYAEVLAETGVAGGVLIAYALFLFFRRAFRNLFVRRWQETEWVQLRAALGCCGLLVHSFVDFNLHIPANALWFAVSVALAMAPTAAAVKAREI